MKHWLIALLVSCVCASAQMGVRSPALVSVATKQNASGTTYLLKENFETPTTGYENTWTEVGVTFTPAFSTAGLSLEGSQCLKIVAVTATPHNTNVLSSTYGTLEMYFLVRFASIPTAATKRAFVAFTDSSGNLISYAGIWDAGSENPSKVTCVNGSVESAASVTAISTDTTYHCWMHYEDNLTTFGFSTTGTRPTTGNNFVTVAGDATAAVKHVITGIVAGNTETTMYYDKIRVNPSIGSNPD